MFASLVLFIPFFFLHISAIPLGAQVLNRSPSTISRELRRKTARPAIKLLAHIFPKGHEHRVSHETIYNGIYAQPAGELRKGLIACMRQTHNKRVPRSKGQDRRDQIPDMLSIHVRPREIEDRQFPGHWEGDLIKDAANASAVGTW